MVQRLSGLHVDHPLTISRLTLQISLEDTEVASILPAAPLYKYRRISNLIRYVFAPVLMIYDTRLTAFIRRNRITVVKAVTTQTTLL